MRKKGLELGSREGVFEAHPPGVSQGEGLCNDMAERNRAGSDGVGSDNPSTPPPPFHPRILFPFVLSCFSRVGLFTTPWTAPVSSGYSKQEYWSGLSSSRGSSLLRDRTLVS